MVIVTAKDAKKKAVVYSRIRQWIRENEPGAEEEAGKNHRKNKDRHERDESTEARAARKQSGIKRLQAITRQEYTFRDENQGTIVVDDKSGTKSLRVSPEILSAVTDGRLGRVKETGQGCLGASFMEFTVNNNLTVSANVDSDKVDANLADKHLEGFMFTAEVGTRPRGADIILDLTVNGTSLWSNANRRPKIKQDEKFVQVKKNWLPDRPVEDGDRIRLAIIQVGSTTAGADLKVTAAFMEKTRRKKHHRRKHGN